MKFEIKRRLLQTEIILNKFYFEYLKVFNNSKNIINGSKMILKASLKLYRVSNRFPFIFGFSNMKNKIKWNRNVSMEQVKLKSVEIKIHQWPSSWRTFLEKFEHSKNFMCRMIVLMHLLSNV